MSVLLVKLALVGQVLRAGALGNFGSLNLKACARGGGQYCGNMYCSAGVYLAGKAMHMLSRAATDR